MILHPGVLALLVGSAAVLFLLATGSIFAVQILRRWDYQSSSEGQLQLERKTYLVSTVVNYALAFQIGSTFLFVFTLDDVHRLLVGAMCATGSLNANPVGWWDLLVKGGLLLASGLWIALNLLDQRAEDYPLVRLKYGFLLVLAPLVALDFVLQLRYFLGLSPDVITSCCGSLFTRAGSTVASTLAGLPPRPTRWVFYGGWAGCTAAGLLALRWRNAVARGVYSTLSAAMLPVSLAAIVSFLSLYIYQMPTHHCPFDFLQREYDFVGYPIYASLALGTFFGTLPGMAEPLKRLPSLRGPVERAQQRWTIWALLASASFLALVSYPVVFGPFRLGSY